MRILLKQPGTMHLFVVCADQVVYDDSNLCIFIFSTNGIVYKLTDIGSVVGNEIVCDLFSKGFLDLTTYVVDFYN